MNSIIKKYAFEIICVFAYILIYSKSYYLGIVNWDDKELLFSNPYVKWLDVKSLLTQFFVGNYMPFTMLTYTALWSLFKLNFGLYHLFSALLHLINSFLAGKITYRLFNNLWLYRLTWLVFLLHPLQVESVCWIAELKTIIAGFFYLLATLYYIKFNDNNKSKYYIVSLAFGCIALLSKPSSVILFLNLLVIDWLLKKTKISILNKIPYFIGGLIIGFLTLKAHIDQQYINYEYNFAWYIKVAYAGYAILIYMRNFLYPLHLSAINPYPDLSVVLIPGYLLLIFGAFIGYYLIKKKKWTAIQIILFILIQIILVVQFIPFGNSLVSDRYMYIAILGMMWLLYIVTQHIPLQRYIIFAWIGLLSIITYTRINVWQSNITLNQSILKQYPNSYTALSNIGADYLLQKKYDLSIGYLNKSIQINPKNYKAYYNRGLYYAQLQNFENALKDFSTSIQNYDNEKARLARAPLYLISKEYDKAYQDLQHILTQNPNNHKAYFMMAEYYYDQNNLQMAKQYYDKAIALYKYDYEYYFQRATVFGKLNNFIACIQDLDKSITLNADFADSYYWRGIAKYNLKINPCNDFQQALQKGNKQVSAIYTKYCSN